MWKTPLHVCLDGCTRRQVLVTVTPAVFVREHVVSSDGQAAWVLFFNAGAKVASEAPMPESVGNVSRIVAAANNTSVC